MIVAGRRADWRGFLGIPAAVATVVRIGDVDDGIVSAAFESGVAKANAGRKQQRKTRHKRQ